MRGTVAHTLPAPPHPTRTTRTSRAAPGTAANTLVPLAADTHPDAAHPVEASDNDRTNTRRCSGNACSTVSTPARAMDPPRAVSAAQ